MGKNVNKCYNFGDFSLIRLNCIVCLENVNFNTFIPFSYKSSSCERKITTERHKIVDVITLFGQRPQRADVL